MSEADSSTTEHPRGRLALLLPMLVTALAVVVAPRIPASETVGLLVASAIAVVPALTGLAFAARAPSTARVGGVMALASLVTVVALYVHGLTSAWLLPVQALALVTLGHATGGAIGTRIQHPGHVLPAMIVAAAADIASVLHPSGPTHAIAESERALGALALAAPVLGTPGFTFVLGAGDLVFAALLLGAAARHGVSILRVALLVLVGVAIAIAIAAMSGAAVPALPAIGLLTVAFVPSFRKLEARDRTTTLVAAALAAAVVAGLLVRARFG